MVNLRRGRLEALLKVLDVDGAVDREGTKWFRTDRALGLRHRALRAAGGRPRGGAGRHARRTRRTTGCRLRFLREQLDDPAAPGLRPVRQLHRRARATRRSSRPAAQAAQQFLRAAPVVLEPRKQWPRGLEGRSGNIAARPPRRGGSGARVRLRPRVVRGRGCAVRAAPTLLPTTSWCAVSPRRSRRGPGRQRPDVGHVGPVALAGRCWSRGSPADSPSSASSSWSTRCAGSVQTAPPQAQMENSATQAANVVDAFEFGRPDGAPLPPGPGLLVDDSMRSGWTHDRRGRRPARRRRGAGAAVRAVAPPVSAVRSLRERAARRGRQGRRAAAPGRSRPPGSVPRR